MPAYVCATCGIQYPPSDEPPPACPVCEDERQWVPEQGQAWTTLDELRREHRNELAEVEPGLTSIHTEPSFAIGQRAHLVQAPTGNVLWDCVTLIDDETVEALERLGGVAAIAISHPHYYSTIVEWSEAFDGAPVYVHEADRRWVVRAAPSVVSWSGEVRELAPGLTLVRCGGHFAGGAVLHWAAGAGGGGALLSGDVVQVVPDQGWVSFMYSYPNFVPLPPAAVERVVAALEPFAFERVHGAFGRSVWQDGKAALRRSAARYVRAVTVGIGDQ